MFDSFTFDDNSDTLTGTIERVTFYNEENGYSVVKVKAEQSRADAEARDGTITVVGVMQELNPGQAARFTGTWVNDPRWGLQFRVETVAEVLPTTTKGIIAYLSSGIVRGIGPRTAEKIVDHFGPKTLDILDHDAERIMDVPGLKPSLGEQLIKAWRDNKAVREVMVFLQGYGITSGMAMKIYGHYGDMTIKVIQQNPYQLADEVFGIGFKRADEIARKMGMPTDAPERIRAGLHYALNHLSREGHTYAPRDVLIETAVTLLEVDDKLLLAAALDGQLVADKLKRDTLVDAQGERVNAIYLPMYYYSELGAVQYLQRLLSVSSKIINGHKKTDWASFLAELAEANNVELTAEQQGAVKAALTSKVSVLTGGPGTGKTTTLQMVIGALAQGDYTFALACPTGRAAKRLNEATGHPAMTIHRLLGWAGDDFTHDEDYPLEVDMLIVDEASMIDLMLFHSLMKALPASTHLMLVGDIDQLPSVGAGNVLRDVIDSGVAYVTRLGQIFRQSEDSHIVLNAHRVNNGDMPFTDNQSSDFFFFTAPDAMQAAEMVVDVVLNRVPDKFGYDPMESVQVIAPMYRGPAGVTALNDALQQRLNGSRRIAEKRLFGKLFRVGDKVMQTRNNYDKDVFNGDIGRLYGIDFDDNTLEVVIDGRFIYYDWSEADELIHAYCISTHRSQGSEYPVVVMPILTQHYMMLQRNLLYTAITRAKELVVLVGDRRAVGMAVKNNKVAERFSGMLERLRAR